MYFASFLVLASEPSVFQEPYDALYLSDLQKCGVFMTTNVYICAECLHYFIYLTSMQYNFHPKGNNRI